MQTINFERYENLALLLWDIPVKAVMPEAAYKIIDDRFAKYLNKNELTDEESALITELSEKYGGGICEGWNG